MELVGGWTRGWLWMGDGTDWAKRSLILRTRERVSSLLPSQPSHSPHQSLLLHPPIIPRLHAKRPVEMTPTINGHTLLPLAPQISFPFLLSASLT